MRTLTDRIRWWIDDRLPEPRQKRWAAVMAAAIVVCGGWILVFAVGTLAHAGSGGGSASNVPESPQVKAALRMTQSLHQDERFTGVVVRPHVDYPDRLRVSGQVATAADLEALRRRLDELAGGRPLVIEATAVGASSGPSR
jgi:hypothetical protein